MNIFIDIETATLTRPEDFSGKLFDIWKERVAKDEDPIKMYKEKWPIYAEYSQVICVSIWYELSTGEIKMKSIYQNENMDEHWLLTDLKVILDNDSIRNWSLIGHNILWFDVPFLVKRYIVNKIGLPYILRVWNMKPWEVKMQDTLKLWKSTWVMGAWLWLICELIGVPSPKWDIDWSETSDAFFRWEYKRIAEYCERDVIAVSLVYKHFINMKIISWS